MTDEPGLDDGIQINAILVSLSPVAGHGSGQRQQVLLLMLQPAAGRFDHCASRDEAYRVNGQARGTTDEQDC